MKNIFNLLSRQLHGRLDQFYKLSLKENQIWERAKSSFDGNTTDEELDLSNLQCGHTELSTFIFWKVSSILKSKFIQGRLERTETSLMHSEWKVTWTHGNQPTAF